MLSRSLAMRALAPGLAFATSISLLGCMADAPSDEDDEVAITQDLSALPAGQLASVLHSGPFGLHSLADEPVPQPIGGHVINQAAAVRLGKAFFWDTQAGGDGRTACATCHASWGADARRFNTVNPGLDGIYGSSGVTGPGQTFTLKLITDDDIIGAQGTEFTQFVSVPDDPTIAAEVGTPLDHPAFGHFRQANFRQAPMIFGAAFMRNLFWGGEASDGFNGATIWGLGPNGSGVMFANVQQAALASQSVGPPGNRTEMSFSGRRLTGPVNSFASKMIARQPLQHQRVSPTDSVLGAYVNPDAPGLWCGGQPCTYTQLIAEAFGPELAATVLDRGAFTVLWGEAIMAYEQTLIPDETPFDKFFNGHFTALTPKQILGLVTFVGRGKCVTCHAGPMLTDATVAFYAQNGAVNRDGGDTGFHNIGMLNSDFDFGRGDVGPAGAPLAQVDSPFNGFAFKTPTLRNIAHTAPYFHTGTKPTLADVVDFYDRGGDFANPQRSRDVKPLHLTSLEKSALVDFMQNSLNDCRIGNARAPFDHPELDVPNGPHLDATGAAGTGACP